MTKVSSSNSSLSHTERKNNPEAFLVDENYK